MSPQPPYPAVFMRSLLVCKTEQKPKMQALKEFIGGIVCCSSTACREKLHSKHTFRILDDGKPYAMPKPKTLIPKISFTASPTQYMNAPHLNLAAQDLCQALHIWAFCQTEQAKIKAPPSLGLGVGGLGSDGASKDQSISCGAQRNDLRGEIHIYIYIYIYIHIK